MMDLSFGKGHQEFVQEIKFAQKHITTEKPETWKQFAESYDDDEIEAMLDSGSAGRASTHFWFGQVH